MKNNFHLIIRQEWNTFVAKVLENNVSSFWKTEKICIENTKEALDLFLENENQADRTIIKFPRLLEVSYNYA